MIHAFTGTTAEHHRRFGLAENIVERWEDGLRTDPAATSFEWWYLDGRLDDGSRITVEFHTKAPLVSPREPLTPYVGFALDRPDGSNVTRTVVAAPQDFSASTESCDVRIGANTFTGDLSDYRIQVDLDGVQADLTLTGVVPAWRPATGHLICGADHVAWLVAVPHGDLSGHLVVDGVRQEVRGAGYHDHNWGTTALRRLVDHWYWGRARVGDYTVAMVNIVARDEFGGGRHPAIMVAHQDRIVAAAGGEDVAFDAADLRPHPETGVPAADRLTFTFEHEDATYQVRFARRRDSFTLDLGKAGAYHRFLGDVVLRRLVGGTPADEAAEAMWELLYFGDRRASAGAAPLTAATGTG